MAVRIRSLVSLYVESELAGIRQPSEANEAVARCMATAIATLFNQRVIDVRWVVRSVAADPDVEPHMKALTCTDRLIRNYV